MAIIRALLTAVLAAASADAIQLWEKPGDIPAAVPARCRAALVQNITCSDFLVKPQNAIQGETVVGGAADIYCSEECSSSINNFQTAVTAGCGGTPYEFFENNTMLQSGKAIADGLVWAHKLVCIEDTSGYCLADMYAGQKDACSDCYLQYGATLQESDYGRSKVPEADFEELLSMCSVDPTKYPYTYTSVPPTTTGGSNSTTTTEPPATSTCPGTTYTSKEGDTCESISLAESVSTDRLVDVNYLDYNCTTLTAGMKLCIQDQCELTTIKPNQTCSDLVAGTGFSEVQLISWNPTLKSACDSRLTPNLDALVGRHFCIQAPGQYDFPTTDLPSSQNWTLTSTMFSSWTTGVVETSPTQGIVTVTSHWDPSYTPPAVTVPIDKEGQDEQADWTKDCWITDEDYDHDFDPYNLAAACQTLYWNYCFYDPTKPSPTTMSRVPAVCTPDRSDYSVGADPDPVVTPKPIQPGMTTGCNKFYKVSAGDGCESVAKANNVTLSDFYEWNPAVGSNCANLQLEVYVCIGFDERLVFPTQTAAPVMKFR